MSHFTVAVIHKPEQNIDDLLAPYYEGLEVEPYIYRTVDKIIEDGINRVERYLKNAKEDPKKYLDVEQYGWMKPYLEAYEAKDWDKMYLAEREGETLLSRFPRNGRNSRSPLPAHGSVFPPPGTRRRYASHHPMVKAYLSRGRRPYSLWKAPIQTGIPTACRSVCRK